MGLFKKLFGGKENKPGQQSDKFSMENLAKLLAPRDPHPESDYVMAGSVSGGIDEIGRTLGPDDLEKRIVALDKQGNLVFVYADSFRPSEVKAFFPLKSYPNIALLKHCAGKRDGMSYMTVDLAGRDIWKKLKEQK